MIKKSLIVWGRTPEEAVDNSNRVLLSKSSLFAPLANVCNWLLKPIDDPVKASPWVAKFWTDNLRLQTFNVVAIAGSK